MMRVFSKKQILIAHRAADLSMAENTMESMIRMAKKGATHFEIDCYFMKDGNIAVIHDKKIKRTTTGRGKITKMTKHDLLDVFVIGGDGKERIPMLPALMDYCFSNGFYLMIEVKDKNVEIVNVIDALIQGYGCDLFSIYSFNKKIIQAFLKKFPFYPVRWSMEKISNRRLNIAKEMDTSINLDGRFVTKSCIEEIEAVGLDVHVYTVNDRARAFELFDIGVRAINTDTLIGGDVDG